MDKCYLGIDNGVSGTIGVVNLNNTYSDTIKTPTFSQQNYTKAKANVTRVDTVKLLEYVNDLKERFDSVVAILERPMVNPTRFKATLSAMRSLEATLNVLEIAEIPYQYIDSKEWQKNVLPKGIKGSTELKKASLDIGNRMFPQFKDINPKHEDRDGLLIAEYARRKKI